MVLKIILFYSIINAEDRKIFKMIVYALFAIILFILLIKLLISILASILWK